MWQLSEVSKNMYTTFILTNKFISYFFYRKGISEFLMNVKNHKLIQSFLYVFNRHMALNDLSLVLFVAGITSINLVITRLIKPSTNTLNKKIKCFEVYFPIHVFRSLIKCIWTLTFYKTTWTFSSSWQYGIVNIIL